MVNSSQTAKEIIKGAAGRTAKTAVKKVSGAGGKGVSVAVNKAVQQLSVNQDAIDGSAENSDPDALEKDSEALKAVHNAAENGKSVTGNVYRNARQAAEVYQNQKKKNRPPVQQAPGTGYPPGQIPQPGQMPLPGQTSTASSPHPASAANQAASGTQANVQQTARNQTKKNALASLRTPGNTCSTVYPSSSLQYAAAGQVKKKQAARMLKRQNQPVKKKARSAAKSVRKTSTKAASAARTAVNASAGAVRTVACASAGTARTAAAVSAGSAAAAATGGTAAVVMVPVGIVKTIGQAAMARLQNSPITRIFGRSGSNSGVGNLNAGYGHSSPLRLAWAVLTAPFTILGAAIGLAGISLLVFVIVIVLVMSSPLRFLFSGADELGEIFQGEEWSALMPDLEQGEDGEILSMDNASLKQLYDAHMDELNDTVSQYQESGYRVIYDGYEGTSAPENYRAALACLIGTCTGQGDMEAGYSVTDILFLTDAAKELFNNLLDIMSSVSVDRENERIHIRLMDCEGYIVASGCSSQEAENIRAVYNGLVSVSGAGGSGQELPEDIARYLDGLTHLPGVQGTVISSALAKLGTPYSQAQRDSGSYYDCSSFVYYSYKSAGISIVYGGANTAAAEAQYCEKYGQIVDVGDLQPGDLLFYSYVNNGRYKNISHVEMFLGDGLIIDCTETPGVSVRQFTTDKLVLCGRPY